MLWGRNGNCQNMNMHGLDNSILVLIGHRKNVIYTIKFIKQRHTCTLWMIFKTQVQCLSEVIQIWSPIEFSEELQQLQEMARRFCREEIMPVAADHDKTGEVGWYYFLNWKSLNVFLSEENILTDQNLHCTYCTTPDCFFYTGKCHRLFIVDVNLVTQKFNMLLSNKNNRCIVIVKVTWLHNFKILLYLCNIVYKIWMLHVSWLFLFD